MIATSELEVPDFKNIQEFEGWVHKLEDKEIQSWTTKDWLKMYEKLEETPRRYSLYENEHLKDALIKLNRNYRLEEADFKKMQEIGKKIGHNLAQQKMDFDLAAVNVKNDYIEGARDQYAKAADKAVYETSQYAGAKETPLGDYNTAASKITISEAEQADYIGVAGEADKYSSEISISNSVEKDVFGSTSLHEGIHAQMQTLRDGQQEALTKLGLRPEESFSEDFYKLLQYNDKYYVESPTDSRIFGDFEIKLQEGEITKQQFEKLTKSEVLKGSTKQPLETHAQIIGVTAEHYYRQETGQLSERAAITLTNMMGKPQITQYNQHGAINLVYRVADKEAFDKKLSSAFDEETLSKITKTYNEKTGQYTLTIPSDYSLKEALKTSATKVSDNPIETTLKEHSGNRRTNKINGASEELLSDTGTTKTTLKNQAKETERATTKAATKATLKTQAANVAKQAGKTAANAASSIGKAALKANAKFDAAVDKAIEKGTQKLNNSKVGKAYNKVAEKAATTKAGKAVAKATSKAVEKAAATTAGKTVGKVVAKTVGTAVGKSVLKKIPLVSAGAGIYFAYERIKNGQWKAAGCEVLSGVAGCFPGVGTAASVAIDVGLGANDVHNALKENDKQIAQAQTKTTTKTQTAKKVAPKDLSKQIAERTEPKKKATQKTTLSTKQITQAQQNSRA